MRLTHFGANSWLLEIDQQRILIDPWLVGSLTFGNLDWLFKGDRPFTIDPLPDSIDLILLSQGLPDHAHRPTLEQLDHAIPVVASPSAAKVVKELGYSQITSLAPGQTITVGDRLEIRAMPGAPIGLQCENAYLIKQLTDGTTLYYEPHGFPPEEIKTYAPVDVVISPIVNLALPVVGPILQGHNSAIHLAEWLKPQVFLPTAADEAVQYEGILINILKTVGSVEEFQAQLTQHNLSTQVIAPPPGEPIELKLKQQV